MLPQRYVFSSKSQLFPLRLFEILCCYCYHKGTYFQANHNKDAKRDYELAVVIATTKVRIFKQITTRALTHDTPALLLLLPQRYVFSSKSQPLTLLTGNVYRCYCYHKGTYFQANHNKFYLLNLQIIVVIATTKVRIFKQITTMQ